jgi:hypothetical protein
MFGFRIKFQFFNCRKLVEGDKTKCKQAVITIAGIISFAVGFIGLFGYIQKSPDNIMRLPLPTIA